MAAVRSSLKLPDHAPADTAISTLAWTARDLAALDPATIVRAQVLQAHDVHRIRPDLDVWDAWPLADASGQPVAWRGGELWFALAAPAFADPEERHGHARIHHFHRRDGHFHHLGVTMPDGRVAGNGRVRRAWKMARWRSTLPRPASGAKTR